MIAAGGTLHFWLGHRCTSRTPICRVLLQEALPEFISVPPPSSPTKASRLAATPHKRNYHAAVGLLAYVAASVLPNARLARAYFLRRMDGCPSFSCLQVRRTRTTQFLDRPRAAEVCLAVVGGPGPHRC
jgi:hypothetical protein